MTVYQTDDIILAYMIYLCVDVLPAQRESITSIMFWAADCVHLIFAQYCLTVYVFLPWVVSVSPIRQGVILGAQQRDSKDNSAVFVSSSFITEAFVHR